MCFTCLNSVRNTKSNIGRTLAETIRISPVRRERGAWGKNCTTFICMSALWCNKYNKTSCCTHPRLSRTRRPPTMSTFRTVFPTMFDCGWCVQGVSFVNSTLERADVWIKHCQIFKRSSRVFYVPFLFCFWSLLCYHATSRGRLLHVFAWVRWTNVHRSFINVLLLNIYIIGNFSPKPITN